MLSPIRRLGARFWGPAPTAGGTVALTVSVIDDAYFLTDSWDTFSALFLDEFTDSFALDDSSESEELVPPVEVDDALTLSDAIETLSGYFFDTKDALSLTDIAETALADFFLTPLSTEAYDSNQWSMLDDLEAYVVVNRYAVDAFTLVDLLYLLYTRFQSVGDDANGLLDGTSFVMAYGLSVDDALASSDAVVANSDTVDLAVAVGDLLSLLDALNSSVPSPTLTQYLRRYLNDVVR